MDFLNHALEESERRKNNELITKLFGVPYWAITFPILVFWLAAGVGILYLIFS